MKILLYTDSRGLSDEERKRRKGNDVGDTYLHYGQKLAVDHDVEMHLAPYNWTTTVNFLEQCEKTDIASFDWVILHTGIVEYAPRRKKSCLTIYERSKRKYDEVFGEDVMREHLSKDFGYPYKNDVAINMYSLDMCRKSLIPILQGIPNLLWISCNRILPSWDGDVEHAKSRPRNMFDMVYDYTNIFLNELDNTVDVLKWTDDDIRKYTFENVHLNKMGSDFVYNKIVEKIG